MNVKTKALTVIEGMTLEADRCEGGLAAACYKFSHVALGKCSNPHEDWLRELDETYSALKKGGII